MHADLSGTNELTKAVTGISIVVLPIVLFPYMMLLVSSSGW